MDKHVFGFLGKPGAGKGAAISEFQGMLAHLASRAPVHRYSDVINECLDLLFIERSRANQQTFSIWARQTFGQDLLNTVMYKRVMAAAGRVVFVDGMRRPPDIVALRKVPNSHLIFVTAPAAVRYERVRRRNDRPGDANMTWEKFLEQDNAETERMVDELGVQADFTINNAVDGLHLLRGQVASIVAAVGLA